jgi:hypothetical protein
MPFHPLGESFPLQEVILSPSLAPLLKTQPVVIEVTPSRSKWNKIEHKIFCFISKSRKRKPLKLIEKVIKLKSNTITSKGLKIVYVEDDNKYEWGIKVTDEELAELSITRDTFHRDWNYKISSKGMRSYFPIVP